MRAYPVLLLTALLAACGSEPPPVAVDAAPVAAVAPPAPTTGCIGAIAAPPLPASWMDGSGREAGADAALDPAAAACVVALFAAPLRTPADLDPAYAPMTAFNADGSGLQLPSLPRQHAWLWRVAGSGGGGRWLLRIDTGAAMDGGRYDIVFATDPAGTLVDQLLVGADGASWQRRYDLSPLQLNVRETTGREQQRGPSYSAVIGLPESGFVLVASELVPAAGAAGGAVGSSLLTVPGGFGDLGALRTALFSAADDVSAEITLVERDGDARHILAIGATEVAGHVVHVLVAVDAQPDPASTTYQVSSFESSQPPNAVGATLGRPAWAKSMLDGTYTVTVPVTYAFVRAGGPPAEGDGDGTTYEVAATIALRYDPASGALTPLD